jgi:integrase
VATAAIWPPVYLIRYPRRRAGLSHARKPGRTDWVPRKMRHTLVSLLSSDGMPLEDIADLVGHKGTMTTGTVYRKVIAPELRRGAEFMDRLFS